MTKKIDHMPDGFVLIFPNIQDMMPNVSPVSCSPLSVLHCLSSTCNPWYFATSESFLACHRREALSPQTSVLSPQSSVLSPHSSVFILQFKALIFFPQSPVLSTQSSVIRSLVLSPQSSVHSLPLPGSLSGEDK